MRCARSAVLLAALVAAGLAPKVASAQSRPELPEGTRIRIVVLSGDLLTAAPEDERATARVVRADADSIAYRLDRSYATRVVPWWQVKELDVSDGRRLRTAADHLGSAAIVTLVGAGVAYSSWHSCNDPESDAIWSCIVLPRRLGTSVRFGAWAGLTVGVLGTLANRHEELWRNVVRSEGPRLLIDHDARSGFRIGVGWRF